MGRLNSTLFLRQEGATGGLSTCARSALLDKLAVAPARPHPRPLSRKRARGDGLPAGGFTLLEVLLVVAMIGILVAVMLPSRDPSLCDQLEATARILSTDLAWGRSLAITNNSLYRYTWDTAANRCILEHSGANTALDTLPQSVFRADDDPANQHILDFDALPHLGAPVRLIAATAGVAGGRVDTLEFGPLGGTTASKATVIWLAVGTDDQTRYITLEVNAVTGLVTIGSLSTEGPAAASR